jgi:TusA-related sulfurtransferase
MKLSRREDGTIVGDFQGLDGARLQLTVKNFIGKLQPGTSVEILMDDPDTHEPILMALREWGCEILHDSLEEGTFRIGVRK